MGHRLSKIYTRTGDSGQTGLGNGERVAKDDLRIHALGEIDELNALIGLTQAHFSQLAQQLHLDDTQVQHWLKRFSLIQHWLFDLGGEICIPDYHVLQQASIDYLEQDIDAMNQQLPMLKDFILPAGNLACSSAHHARTVCRRAERSLFRLQQRDQNIQQTALQFINRLSDWLFVAARALQRLNHESEVLWQKNMQF
ncbi:MAG: cob(I)yrinic acid a,c-diamide adenosyltransferase [Acinetobacter sp.]|nr:cob(I)yrinic acid a,c-diamide adenosyltransferase [Acinetobacter sp.]